MRSDTVSESLVSKKSRDAERALIEYVDALENLLVAFQATTMHQREATERQKRELEILRWRRLESITGCASLSEGNIGSTLGEALSRIGKGFEVIADTQEQSLAKSVSWVLPRSRSHSPRPTDVTGSTGGIHDFKATSFPTARTVSVGDKRGLNSSGNSASDAPKKTLLWRS